MHNARGAHKDLGVLMRWLAEICRRNCQVTTVLRLIICNILTTDALPPPRLLVLNLDDMSRWPEAPVERLSRVRRVRRVARVMRE